jgi:ATP-dependent Clp protease ATP-binding subunit ClpA
MAVPQNKDLKRLVRRRMGATGESYTRARRTIVRRATTPSPPDGGAPMYPFERFTERAKQLLIFSQQEAELLERPHISGLMIVLGMLRGDDSTLAGIILRSRGVTRTAVEEVEETDPEETVGHGGEVRPGVFRPVRAAHAMVVGAFEAASEMGDDFVGTEHILLGLLTEQTGAAGRMLRERYGMSVAGVIEEIRALRARQE